MNQGDANFRGGLQKHILPAPLYWHSYNHTAKTFKEWITMSALLQEDKTVYPDWVDLEHTHSFHIQTAVTLQ